MSCIERPRSLAHPSSTVASHSAQVDASLVNNCEQTTDYFISYHRVRALGRRRHEGRAAVPHDARDYAYEGVHRGAQSKANRAREWLACSKRETRCTARAMAGQIGLPAVGALLSRSLAEEEIADNLLTQVARELMSESRTGSTKEPKHAAATEATDE